MTEIDVPDPALVVLVGAAGSGKTTFARRHFGPDEVLSSDAYRALISGSETDQAATRPAFGLLHRAVVSRLAAGRLTVVDATNVQRHARRALVKRARLAGIPIAAIVLDLPPDVVLARNASRRERIVDEAVVRMHLADVERAAAPGSLEAEGFDLVVRLRSPEEVDGLSIRRTPTPAGQVRLPPTPNRPR